MRCEIAVLAGTLALAALAQAAPKDDGLKVFQAKMHSIERREAAWWKALPNAEVKAHAEFHRPLRQQYAEKVTEPRPNWAPIRTLYAGALSFEKERETAYAELAASGHPKTLATLWREALAAADVEERAERDNAPGKLPQVVFLLRQGPSLRIHGLALRRQALAKAFAASAGSAAFLGAPTAWKQARSRDLRARSVARRVFTVDALAGLGDAAGRERLRVLLEDESPEVRIAALEGLGRAEGGLPFHAAGLLADTERAVQFAVLDVLRACPPADARWIEPLGKTYFDGRGRLRADALRALQAATGRTTPDEPSAWQAWLDQSRAAREAGTFRRPDHPAQTASSSSAGSGSQARFWGIPVESNHVLVAADGGPTLVVPADHALQVTRHVTDWVTGQRGWRKEHESIRDVIARLVPRFLEKLPEGARFRVLLLGRATNLLGDVSWFGKKGALPPTRGNRRKAAAFVEGYSIGTSEFFQQGLRIILDTKQPDTAVLVTAGYLRTDRFLLPDALVAEFRRRNRFRRLRLHVVHVMDQGPESGRLLRELAESSGGTIVRALSAPPR